MSAVPLGGGSASSLSEALHLNHPAWLALLLLAVPVVLGALRASLAAESLSRAQVAVIAALRILVLTGVALALAGPSVRRPARAVSTVVLLDVSDSIPASALPFEAGAAAALARAAAEGGHRAPRFVRFAARPEEVEGLATPGGPPLARFSEPDGSATDLALALGFGAGLVDTAAVPRLLVISDGVATRGDLAGAAERLAGRGIAVYAMAPPPIAKSGAGDVAVVGLSAPEDIRPRAPFPLRVTLEAEQPGSVTVCARGDPPLEIDDPVQVVPVVAGTNTASFTARIIDAGTSVARVHLEPPAPVTGRPVDPGAGDPHPENDDGVLLIEAARPPRALILEGAMGSATALRAALQSERIAVDVRAADARSVAGSAGDWGRRYDLVVLADVPRAALSDAGLASLEEFVREGGGLLVTGGTNSFGPGGYRGSRLEAMLPVRLDVPDREEEASLALALVIDKSGSMGGPKMELTKEAARATAETLPPDDQIAIVVFDSQATPIVRLQRASNRQAIQSDISRIQPSGGTNILAGLREAVDELLPARARKKHVIVLSDGQSPYDDIPDLVDAAAAARITVSAVGVGDGADQTLLKLIASRGGGRFYHTRDPSSIPRIFSRETSELGARGLVDRSTSVRVTKRAAALAGVPLADAPALAGYVAAGKRAAAETLLATGDGAPLLARWPVGLGQVTAWMSDLGARWAGAWTRWPPFQKLWAQVVRATMRRRAALHFPVRSVLASGVVQLAVDALGPDERFLSGLEGHVKVSAVDAGGRPIPPRDVELTETAPGRYEASFRPDPEARALLFQAALATAGAAIADASGRLTIPFADELRPHPEHGPSVAAALMRAVRRTGGRVITDVRAVLDRGPGGVDDERRSSQPLLVPVVLTTLLLFVAELLVRRLRFPNRRH